MSKYREPKVRSVENFVDEETKCSFDLIVLVDVSCVCISSQWEWVKDTNNPKRNNRTLFVTIGCYQDSFHTFKMPMNLVADKTVELRESFYSLDDEKTLILVVCD